MIRLSNQGRIILLATLVMLCGAMTEARAGTITAGQLIAGCGTVTVAPITPANLGKSFTQICNMDIVFTVTNSATSPQNPTGLTQINFSELVGNTTGQTWFDFHMQLGFGTGTGFTPAVNCAVGFTTLPMPASNRFMVRGVSSSAVDFAGGTVPTGTNVNFTFSVNVQNLSQCVPPGSQSQLQNGYTFTLRETPSVPEPTTMVLLGTGLLGVAIKVRKRIKSRNSGQGSVD